jgi:hypothetical protein
VEGERVVRIVRDAVHRHRAPDEEIRIEALNPSALLQIMPALRIRLCGPKAQHLTDVRILDLLALLDILCCLGPHLLFPPPDGFQLALQLAQGVVPLRL